jgi:uncharacterized membrane protein YeaQ/YmgE (transglycosylase-associated protein family)
MKDEIQKKIDPKKSFIIDIQNIILTGIIGISFAHISASILANNGTKLHIGTAVIAILGAQIISFVLTVQVLTMAHRRYQITVITALVFSTIAWYAPDFLWKSTHFPSSWGIF